MYDWAFLKNKVERWWLYIFLFIKKNISHLKRSRQERYFAYAKNLIPSKTHCLQNEMLDLNEVQVHRLLFCPLLRNTDS